jgi:hypothetical protein
MRELPTVAMLSDVIRRKFVHKIPTKDVELRNKIERSSKDEDDLFVSANKNSVEVSPQTLLKTTLLLNNHILTSTNFCG